MGMRNKIINRLVKAKLLEALKDYEWEDVMAPGDLTEIMIALDLDTELIEQVLWRFETDAALYDYPDKIRRTMKNTIEQIKESPADAETKNLLRDMILEPAFNRIHGHLDSIVDIVDKTAEKLGNYLQEKQTEMKDLEKYAESIDN